MFNEICLMGKLKEEVVITETVNKNRIATIKLEVERGFQNSSGQYDTDIIPVVLWKGKAASVAQKCKIGDPIAVAGRIQSKEIVGNDGNKMIALEVIGEKIEFFY